ncbi:MAG: hypothetical protein C0402_09165 [Thermodesulfovibrio sp.]|nr:hypothetical protein [Thermodesulfovibrio sp.]
MNRDFFEGYAERIDIDAFFSDDLGKAGDSGGGMNIDVMFKGRVKNYVENRTLLIKEFELDVYKTPDGRYIIHICRLDGSSNFCDYYLVDRLHLPLKFRIVRALFCESLEPDDIYFELGMFSEEMQEVAELLSGVRTFSGLY